MKKFARLTALLLAGALLFLMTACGGPTAEQKAKMDVLNAINSYRAAQKLNPVQEVKQLSALEEIWAAPYRKAQKSELPESALKEMRDAYNKMDDTIKDWEYCDDLGVGWFDGKDEDVVRLTFKIPTDANALQSKLASAVDLDCENITAVGMAVVNIEGDGMYLICVTYHPEL